MNGEFAKVVTMTPEEGEKIGPEIGTIEEFVTTPLKITDRMFNFSQHFIID